MADRAAESTAPADDFEEFVCDAYSDDVGTAVCTLFSGHGGPHQQWGSDRGEPWLTAEWR